MKEKKESTQKLSEKQLQKLNAIQSEMQKIQSEIGGVEIQIEMFKERKSQLIRAVGENQSKLQELLKDIEEEFGKGSIDINTGEFVPAEQPTQG